MEEFKPFPKISRWNRLVIVTEKIDGTNACVVVGKDGMVQAQSRSRIITPENDNYGFAAWVRDHAEELQQLGPGYHFGEWWGQGIQRGYGLKDRRFSLFNVSKWIDRDEFAYRNLKGRVHPPECCHVVPLLCSCDMEDLAVEEVMAYLRLGSYASPGFRTPEGIVIYHTASGTLFKKTLEGDESGKEAMAAMPAAA